jgi:Flp pilus assembly protein TadG
MALELAILAPVLIVLIMLLVLYGRLSQVQGLVEATARDGARASTQSRSYDEAFLRVSEIRDDLAGRAPASCADNADYTIEPPVFEPGAAVTVVVTCTVSFSDLGVPGAPGTVDIERSFTSVLDPYRGLDEAPP